MKVFFKLLKINLRNFLIPNNGSKNRKTGKQKQKGLGGIIIFLVSMYTFMSLYSFFITAQGIGQTNDLGLAFGTSMGTLMVLVFTFTNAHAVLFKSKDFDLLMCLPIDTKTIIASKLVTVSVLGYVYFSFSFIPSLIFYLVLIEFNIIVLLCGLLVFICAPLLILTVSSFFSILIGLVTQKMKHKNAITSFAYLLFVLAVFITSYSVGFTAGQDISEDGEFANALRETLLRVNPIGNMVVNAAQGSVSDLLILIIISLIPFAIFLFVCSKLYVRLNSSSKDGYKNKNFKLKKEDKQGSPMKALIKREFKTFVGTPVYLTNVLISPIMGMIIIILGSVVIAKNGQFIFEGDQDTLIKVIPMGLVALSSWAFGVSPATSVIINMEGRKFWLIKSLPISEKQILWSKVLFSMIIYVPFILIGTLVSIILLTPNPIDAICMVLSPIAYSLCFSFVGLLLNTKFYNIDWDNATQAVKSGAGMLLSMLIDMGISGLIIAPFVAGIIFGISLSYIVLLIGCLCALLFGLLLFKVGIKNFSKITI